MTYGLRNPFRFTFRPGTNELWIGDVGWNAFEEIDRIVDPTSQVTNFGWPCFEGFGRQSAYDGFNLSLCENLYAQPGIARNPYYIYTHQQAVVPGETCDDGSSDITGLAFYQGGDYPSQYDGALFFADYSRDCIWAMFPGTNGLPDPANIITFANAQNPVDLEIGPTGDLFFVNIEQGKIDRFEFAAGNQPPVAAIQATPTSGPPSAARELQRQRLAATPRPGPSATRGIWTATASSTTPSRPRHPRPTRRRDTTWRR